MRITILDVRQEVVNHQLAVARRSHFGNRNGNAPCGGDVVGFSAETIVQRRMIGQSGAPIRLTAVRASADHAKMTGLRRLSSRFRPSAAEVH